MKLFKLLLTLMIAALALPACANSPTYSEQPESYFSDPVQLALAEAAGRGDIEAMQEALNQGADPNAPGKDGMTPLFWSATDTMGANIEGFRYLLEHGGDPNLVIVDEDKPGKSTIHLIYLAFTQTNPEFLEAALEAGADPNTVVSSIKGQTLLFEDYLDEYIDNVKLLIEYGADVNYRGQFQQPPLISAIAGSDYKAALAFVEAGADPNLENEVNGITALGLIKSNHDRQDRSEGSSYSQLINALKEKGLGRKF
ncbi:ankyrin repeat domain-containing protein [Halomonas sp. CUBES01]|uniref:ankyrin repeat domain-containing protein n=1 Tax=Halomonas sp. CUBES01 TaxID=2897340 RepID=UPI001E2911A8|nr:ankyrin repeat domain-containing protein [Halomonas sp. CUBES01]MEC4766138.1 ankyrin repeat domain-containing protein [Halomonas sp. CUBES01]